MLTLGHITLQYLEAIVHKTLSNLQLITFVKRFKAKYLKHKGIYTWDPVNT